MKTFKVLWHYPGSYDEQKTTVKAMTGQSARNKVKAKYKGAIIHKTVLVD